MATVTVGTRGTRVVATSVSRTGDAVGTSVRSGVMTSAIVRPRSRVMAARMTGGMMADGMALCERSGNEEAQSQ